MGLLSGIADLAGAKGLASNIRSIQTPTELATRRVGVQEGRLDLGEEQLKQQKTNDNIRNRILETQNDISIYTNQNLSRPQRKIAMSKSLARSGITISPDQITDADLAGPAFKAAKEYNNLLDEAVENNDTSKKTQDNLNAKLADLANLLGADNTEVQFAKDRNDERNKSNRSNAAAELAQITVKGENVTTEESKRAIEIPQRFGASIIGDAADIAEKLRQGQGGGLSQLTPTVRTEILAGREPGGEIAQAGQRVQQGKIDVAKAGVVAKAEARADLPIPTNELIRFVDENGFFPPANLTPNLAEELGFFPISEASKKQVQAVGNVGEIIKEMQPMVDRLFKAEGFWDRVTGAFPNLQAYFLQEGNEQLVVDAAQYVAMKHGIAGQFSKVVSGEGGRLTEQDIQRVLGLFPTFFNSVFLADTKIVAQRKMQFLSKRLEDERRRILTRDGLKPQGTFTEAADNISNITTPTETTIDIGDRKLSDLSIEELIELKRGQ